MSRTAALARAGILSVALSLAAAGVAPAVAAGATGPTASAPGPAVVTDYCQGQCADILPPGENGNATFADILLNRTFGTRPAHTDDQLAKYASLVDGYTGLTNSTLSQFFNDASFGVPAAQVA